ncbi:MAG: hypothetical protein MJ231_04610 [bacterium]|nr:hypothetical protein [bacterium]
MTKDRIENVMTEWKKGEYAELTRDVKDIEALLERFFEMIFETTTASIERDFHFTEI